MLAQSKIYESLYSQFSGDVTSVIKKLREEGGTTIKRVADTAGPDGAQALFDAVMDAGARQALVQSLNSPSIPGWAREQLEVFLYGESALNRRSGQIPALFKATPRRDFH